VEEEAKRRRLELGPTIQTWLRRSRRAEEYGLHRNPHPARDANCNLNMVADDRARFDLRLSIPDSRVFQSHWPKAERKPHPVPFRSVMFGYDLLRNLSFAGYAARRIEMIVSPWTGSEHGLC
jgi:hypothetical protein